MRQVGGQKLIKNMEVTLWSVTFAPLVKRLYNFGEYTAYNAILDEIAHALGFVHSNNDNDLMSVKTELQNFDKEPLEVSNCDAHTALDQNRMLHDVPESKFPTYSVFVGEDGYNEEDNRYYECINLEFLNCQGHLEKSRFVLIFYYNIPILKKL